MIRIIYLSSLCFVSSLTNSTTWNPINNSGKKKCPFLHSGNGTKSSDWWKNNLSLKILNQNKCNDPMPSDFDYATEFGKLDLTSLKHDLTAMMIDSQDFWPADVSQSSLY